MFDMEREEDGSMEDGSGYGSGYSGYSGVSSGSGSGFGSGEEDVEEVDACLIDPLESVSGELTDICCLSLCVSLPCAPGIHCSLQCMLHGILVKCSELGYMFNPLYTTSRMSLTIIAWSGYVLVKC